MRNRALRILGVVWVSGLSGWCNAWAQAPAVPASTDTPPAAVAPTVTPSAGDTIWERVKLGFDRSVDELTEWEAWGSPAHWRAAVSPYTKHYRYSPEHRHVFAIALERQREDGWLAGASLFRNSFGQPSSYAYIGRRFDNLLGEPQLFGQVSGGVLYGYKGAYRTKVPLNFRGFAPGALVTVGWRSDNGFSAAVHALGDAGVMLQFALDLP